MDLEGFKDEENLDRQEKRKMVEDEEQAQQKKCKEPANQLPAPTQSSTTDQTTPVQQQTDAQPLVQQQTIDNSESLPAPQVNHSEQPPPRLQQQQEIKQEKPDNLGESTVDPNTSLSAEVREKSGARATSAVQEGSAPVQLDGLVVIKEEPQQRIVDQQEPAQQSSEALLSMKPETGITDVDLSYLAVPPDDDTYSASLELLRLRRSDKVNRQVNKDDDLEEGELKDDDDDDDHSSPSVERVVSSSTTSSSSPSSSSSSSSASTSKDRSSSSSSSTNRTTNPSTRLSSAVYRMGRDKEDPSEKAAKLITMRTRLLEARAREIELKFQRNKGMATQPVHQPAHQPSLISFQPERNLKMTVAKPSISYAENPKPSYTSPVKAPKKSSKSKSVRKKKKKKKSSSSKNKKHKTDKTSQEEPDLKGPRTPPEHKGPRTPPDHKNPRSPLDHKGPRTPPDHQGPRTPPDNHVMTLEDQQIEWPSHLIRMTTTQPSIPYSVNPSSVLDLNTNSRATSISGKKKDALSGPGDKKIKTEVKPSSNSSSPQTSSHRTEDGSLAAQEPNLNSDFSWYYNYFSKTFEMDENQARHQAYSAILSFSTYDKEAVDKWLRSRGFTREDTIEDKIDDREEESAKVVVTRLSRNQVNRDNEEHPENVSLNPLKPSSTVIKSQTEIVLPNGQVLPPGTIQKIVHPYPRPDSEILGCCFDLYS